MGLFNLFKKAETRETATGLEELLLQANLVDDIITRQKAMQIPTLAGCVELISNIISTLPIKLYQEADGKVKEIKGDIRTQLLNDDTGDTLDAFQFKKAMIEDYLLKGNAYAYINKEKGSFKSINYVKDESVTVNMNADPIFKSYSILVNGDTYKPYEFIKLLRNTRNGATGIGIIEENSKILAVAYNLLDYENILAKTGGNKKGFIKSAAKLTEAAIETLKQQWKNMYSKNSENCVVLNNGLEFQASSATPTEMQLNDSKISNGNEICKILNVPPASISSEGRLNEDDQQKLVKMAILPILKAFITALNRDFLLEKEKESFYFAFDIKELLKGDIEKRYKADEIGVKNGFLSINEVRYEEDYDPIEAFENTIKLGLQDVLYNTKTGSIYTPNTDKTSNMNAKGGEKDEDRDKE